MKFKFRKIFEIGIVKTLIFNINYFGIYGLKFPVLVSKKVELRNLKGMVTIENPYFGCVKLGFEGVSIFDYRYERSIWDNVGKIKFLGKATLGQGTRISNKGELVFGDNFRLTAQSSIICYKRITFGDTCLVSWNCCFMDTDLHKIKDLNGVQLNENRDITIGNHVWIGSDCIILKGSSVGDDCIVGAGTMLTSKRDEKKSIIGSNGIVLRSNILWEP